MRTRSVVAAITLGLVGLLAPGAAAASCAEFPPLEEHLAQAEVVFVGTVVSVTDEQRTALVQVEEIWRGPELPAEVTVHGGFPDLGFTSADRSFETGVRYLFAPSLNEGRIEDNACTATQAWSDDLAAFRPTSTSTPEPTPADQSGAGGVPVAALVVALSVMLVAGVSIVAFRRR